MQKTLSLFPKLLFLMLGVLIVLISLFSTGARQRPIEPQPVQTVLKQFFIDSL